MAVGIAWPSELPELNINFSAKAGFQNNRLVMDSNRVRQYPQFTKGVETVEVRWQMTSLQLSIFKQFYAFDLNQGTKWFDFNVPNPDGETFTETIVRFLGGYKEQYADYDNWSITAKLEYSDVSILAEGSFSVTTNPDGSIDWPQTLLGYPSTFNVAYEPANAISSITNARLNIRQKATQRTELADITYQFDQSQYAIFRYTYEVHLHQGNDWFRVTLPIPNDTDANAFQETWARFVSDYSASYVGVNNWDVKVRLEYQLPDLFVSLVDFANDPYPPTEEPAGPPTIDPSKYYCSRWNYWYGSSITCETYSGDPSYVEIICSLGSFINSYGGFNVCFWDPGISVQVIEYISGPYDTLGECNGACGS